VDTEGMLDPTQTAPDRIEAGLAAASATYGLGPGLPVLAVATLVLVLAGFYRHMKEYEGWRQ
jgi:hypothetical protein